MHWLYVDSMNEAVDLLSHEMSTRDIAELHARAMQALVAQLRNQKRADTSSPRPATRAGASRTLQSGAATSRPRCAGRCGPRMKHAAATSMTAGGVVPRRRGSSSTIACRTQTAAPTTPKAWSFAAARTTI